MRPLVASINLAALKANFNLAQQLAPASQNFAVLKANAYGHGSIQCAKALDQAAGFAVATVEEAVELRQAKIDKPILILSTFSQIEEVELLYRYNLMPTIHSQFQLDLLSHHKSQGTIHCWLKVDTGMNRLGLSRDEFLNTLKALADSRRLKVVAVMSHLASADETINDFTQIQLNNFNLITQGVNLPLSLANSSAILAWPDTFKHWNRPGLMLYGASMLDSANEHAAKLIPVMKLKSQLIAVKTLNKGEAVGYGQTFVATKKMRTGVVACGYADGFPRNAATGTSIIVCKKRVLVLGRVSMDTLSVDLTELPHAQVGDPVTLWGHSDLSVSEIALKANTIAYELLVNVSRRVPREYHN